MYFAARVSCCTRHNEASPCAVVRVLGGVATHQLDPHTRVLFAHPPLPPWDVVDLHDHLVPSLGPQMNLFK